MARKKRPKWKVAGRQACLRMVGIMGLLSVIASLVSIAVLERARGSEEDKLLKRTTRIAFGSGTSVDYRPQPIWVQGIVPSNPDVWIWTGDMAYMDKPWINCDAMAWHEQCNCTNTWLHQANLSCMAGNVAFASSRVEVQLSNPDYAQFLSFMCPGHRVKGLHPPTGSDLSICPRQILGTYGGHDYGWGYGNKRLPQKDQMKQIFLDAMGEPSSSPRRDPGRGIQWKYTMDNGLPNQTIDIYLLDERYYRDSLPCHMRKAFCEKVALIGMDHAKHAWCTDFLHGGQFNNGSCCEKDEEIFYGWCLEPRNKDHNMWNSVCDPNSPEFGSSTSSRNIEDVMLAHDSSFCEILGQEQRRWLEKSIMQSNSPLKLVVSSSVVIGNPAKKVCEDLSGVECPCSDDDWECYKPAQLQFLNVISRASGCVILLTGGLEYSDIKVLNPGANYIKKHYGGIELSYPLYQVMASGLTATAERNFSCDVVKQDPLQLRDHPECDFVRAPAFGMIEVNWGKDPSVKIQIRDGMTGNVKLESSLRIGQCLPHSDWSRKMKW